MGFFLFLAMGLLIVAVVCVCYRFFLGGGCFHYFFGLV